MESASIDSSQRSFHDQVEYFVTYAMKPWSISPGDIESSESISLPKTILEEKDKKTKLEDKIITVKQSVQNDREWRPVMKDFYKHLKNIEVFISM